jgi:hypothetical protein
MVLRDYVFICRNPIPFIPFPLPRGRGIIRKRGLSNEI